MLLPPSKIHYSEWIQIHRPKQHEHQLNSPCVFLYESYIIWNHPVITGVNCAFSCSPCGLQYLLHWRDACDTQLTIKHTNTQQTGGIWRSDDTMAVMQCLMTKHSVCHMWTNVHGPTAEWTIQSTREHHTDQSLYQCKETCRHVENKVYRSQGPAVYNMYTWGMCFAVCMHGCVQFNCVCVWAVCGVCEGRWEGGWPSGCGVYCLSDNEEIESAGVLWLRQWRH